MKKIFIILFVCILIGPSIIWMGIKDYIKTETTENRVLAEKPELALNNLENFPSKYENYYNDHLPFKGQAVKLKSYMDYKLFNYIDSDKVLLGKRNWLFYRGNGINELPINDYQGINYYSEEKKEKIKKNVQSVNNELKKKGIDFSIMICPNKEHIYHEYLPDTIFKVNKKCRADLLVEHLEKETNVPIIYPVQDLEEEKNNQLYYKYDTHWNRLGGFVGEQCIRRLYQGKYDSLGKQNIRIEQRNPVTDLANMINLQSEFKDDKNFYVDDYKKNVVVEIRDFTENYYLKVYHSNAPDKRKVMVLRDSYGEAMMDYLAKDFRDVIFIHRDIFKKEDIETFQPDIIIYQMVERATDSMLQLEKKFGINKK